MSPTEPHVFLNVDGVQSLFSDELLTSGANQTQTRAVSTKQSWRTVHRFTFSVKAKTRMGKRIKNKVQTLLFCLYKGTSLFIPKTFLLKNKTKQKKIAFRWPYTNGPNGKGLDQMTRGILTI